MREIGIETSFGCPGSLDLHAGKDIRIIIIINIIIDRLWDTVIK